MSYPDLLFGFVHKRSGYEIKSWPLNGGFIYRIILRERLGLQ